MIKWIIGIASALTVLIIAGVFVWYVDSGQNEVKQDSEIKRIDEKCTNVGSMTKSNDESLDLVITDVAVIKATMVTKDDLSKSHDKLKKDITREFEKIFDRKLTVDNN